MKGEKNTDYTKTTTKNTILFSFYSNITNTF